MNMLLPRETSSASNPQAIAPENAWPTNTRHAMLPVGFGFIITVLTSIDTIPGLIRA